jgi:diguanylate cyclase (GGDEF)-like protein
MSESFYSDLFAVSPAASFVLDPASSEIVAANQAAAGIWQCTSGLAAGRSWGDFFPEQRMARAAIAALEAQAGKSCVLLQRDARGATRRIEACAAPLLRSGQRLLLVVLHDASKRSEYALPAGGGNSGSFAALDAPGRRGWAEDAPRRNYALSSDPAEKAGYDRILWTQANVDALTGLPNRSLLRQRLEQQLSEARAAKNMLALLSIDLDGFKEINDTLGHGIGDQLLIETAKRIRAGVRTTDTVARIGGDGFAVVLANLSALDAIEAIGQKLIDALGAPFLIGLERIYVSASIGIAIHPDDADCAETLLATADQAMHAAKKSGCNRYQFFTRSLHQQALQRIQLIRDLREAIDCGQFKLMFQPIVDLRTGQVVKAEALLRWRHPQRGMVSPAEFIPVAESAGLIVLIGDWVFRQAVQWAARWMPLAPSGFQISVNVSPAQFRLDQDLPARWIDYCRKQRLPQQALVIEITEGLLLEAGKPSMDRLRAFREAGMQIALDDFGTGYSGLAYLRSFSIDYIKIDQAFVRDMHLNSADVMLSEAIVAMAHKLGLKVVAEGIELHAHRKLLTGAACDYGQGYLFSRPLSPQDFEAMLAGAGPAPSAARAPAYG